MKPIEKPAFIPPPLKEIELLSDSPLAFKRLLIMEDEPSLQKTMEAFLGSNHFDVTFINSALEGLHEIKETDFDLVLCNMIKPSFAGEMFYRAVERLQPAMCPRFIYVVGEACTPDADAFVMQVNGLKLWKPFELHVLLETILLGLKKASTATAPIPTPRLPVLLAERSSSTDSKLQQLRVEPKPAPAVPRYSCPVRDIRALTRLALAQAGKSVRFATTDFSPDESLVNWLETAAKRGVNVTLLIPRKTKTQVHRIAPRAILQRFASAGISVLETEFRMEPVLMIVIDEEWACFSRSKLAYQNLTACHGKAARKLLQDFEQYRAAARPVADTAPAGP